jgi:hypothetical protein
MNDPLWVFLTIVGTFSTCGIAIIAFTYYMITTPEQRARWKRERQEDKRYRRSRRNK